jgi:hypothetical protein
LASECIAQNLVRGADRAPGETGPLRADACALVELEDNPAVAAAWKGGLNRALRDGGGGNGTTDFGAVGTNIKKMARFVTVIATTFFGLDPFEDIKLLHDFMEKVHEWGWGDGV